jgi:hypothetical protein
LISSTTYNHIHMAISLDKATLEAALIGYRRQLQEIEANVEDIRRTLSKHAQRGSVKHAVAAPVKKKHMMSVEGRARIAAAQRARWAKSKNGG